MLTGRSWLTEDRAGMMHELWRDEDGATGLYVLPCRAGGNQVRASLPENAELIWTVEADSYFDAMTKYHEFMDLGEYKIPTDWEDTKDPCPPAWIETQKDRGD